MIFISIYLSSIYNNITRFIIFKIPIAILGRKRVKREFDILFKTTDNGGCEKTISQIHLP